MHDSKTTPIQRILQNCTQYDLVIKKRMIGLYLKIPVINNIHNVSYRWSLTKVINMQCFRKTVIRTKILFGIEDKKISKFIY